MLKTSKTTFLLIILILCATIFTKEANLPQAKGASNIDVTIDPKATLIGSNPTQEIYDYIVNRAPNAAFALPESIHFRVSAANLTGAKLESQSYFYDKPSDFQTMTTVEGFPLQLDFAQGAVYAQVSLIFRYYPGSSSDYVYKTIRLWTKPKVTVSVSSTNVPNPGTLDVYGSTDPISFPVKIKFTHDTDPSLSRVFNASVTDWQYFKRINVPADLADGIYKVEVTANENTDVPEAIGRATLASEIVVGKGALTSGETPDKYPGQGSYIGFIVNTLLDFFKKPINDVMVAAGLLFLIMIIFWSLLRGRKVDRKVVDPSGRSPTN